MAAALNVVMWGAGLKQEKVQQIALALPALCSGITCKEFVIVEVIRL